MSTITGLISAGGGGGAGGGETHIVTDPLKLPRYSAPGFILRSALTTARASNSSAFFLDVANSEGGAYTTVSSSNTYATVLDITSATNGGYLHWVISPTVDRSGQTTTVKITRDSVATELVYEPPTTQDARMFIGGGAYIADQTATTSSTSYLNRSSNYFAMLFQDGTAFYYDDPTNNVYYSGGYSLNYNYLEQSRYDLMTYPYHRLYFESSLKVEVKQSNYYTSSAGNYAACYYTLI